MTDEEYIAGLRKAGIRIVAWLRENPESAAKVLRRLKIAGPWRKRGRFDTKRSDCDEWFRASITDGAEVAEVYKASFMDGFSDGDDDHKTLAKAKASEDARLARGGWVLTP